MVRMGDARGSGSLSLAPVPFVLEYVSLVLQEQLQIGPDDLTAATGIGASTDWKKASHEMRIERELFERYGYLKDVILHPNTQSLLNWIEENVDLEPFGEPWMPFVAAITTLLLLHRRVSSQVLVLIGCILFAVNPLYVLAVIILIRFATGSKSKSIKRITNYKPPADYLTYLPEIWDISLMPQQFDHIIIGNDIASYFTAALLTCMGRKCVLLEPRFVPSRTIKMDGCCSEVAVFDLSLGRVERYQYLLDLVCPRGDRVTFSPVGTKENGFTHTALKFLNKGKRSSPTLVGVPTSKSDDVLLLRPGSRALENDLADQFSVDRAQASVLIAKMNGIQDHLTGYLLTRAVPAASVNVILTQQQETKHFWTAASTTCKEFLSKLTDSSNLYGCIMGIYNGENLPARLVSSAALINAVTQSATGLFYPDGGFASLQIALARSIRWGGGAVFTDVPVTQIQTDIPDAKNLETVRVVGVRIGQNESILTADSIISGVGTLCTFTHLLSKDSVPTGTRKQLSALREQRPRMRVCVVLQGSPESLGISPEDYVEIVAQELEPMQDQLESKSADQNKIDDATMQELREGYLKISFPSLKDSKWSEANPGVHTCIIEAETPESWLATSTVKFSIPELGSESGPTVYESVTAKRSPAGGTGELSVATETRKGQINSLVSRLMTVYPAIQASHVKSTVFLPPSLRCNPLSHSPERYTSAITAATEIGGLFLTGEDVATGMLSGALQAGWVTANSVLGYSASDLALGQNVIPDLQKVAARK